MRKLTSESRTGRILWFDAVAIVGNSWRPLLRMTMFVEVALSCRAVPKGRPEREENFLLDIETFGRPQLRVSRKAMNKSKHRVLCSVDGDHRLLTGRII